VKSLFVTNPLVVRRTIGHAKTQAYAVLDMITTFNAWYR